MARGMPRSPCSPGRPTAGAQTAAERELVRRYAPIMMFKENPDPPCSRQGEQYRLAPGRHHPREPRGAAAAAAIRRVLPSRARTLATAPTASDLAGLGRGLLPRPARATLAGPAASTRVPRPASWTGARPSSTPTSPGSPGVQRDRRPVLVLLLVQPVQRPARERLGDDPGRLRRRHGRRRRSRAAPPSSRTRSTKAGSAAAGTTPGSRRRGRTRSSTPPRARTRASTGRRSSSGTGGSGSGLGCDDTRGPSTARRADADPIVPTYPGLRLREHAWLTYRGHWGQHEPGVSNGPTGPNMKRSVAGAVPVDERPAYVVADRAERTRRWASR